MPFRMEDRLPDCQFPERMSEVRPKAVPMCLAVPAAQEADMQAAEPVVAPERADSALVSGALSCSGRVVPAAEKLQGIRVYFRSVALGSALVGP